MKHDWASYAKTGFKVWVLTFLLGLIYTGFNFLMSIMFAGTIISILLAGTMGFAFIMAIILLVAWIALSLIIGGFLAQKIWKWD